MLYHPRPLPIPDPAYALAVARAYLQKVRMELGMKTPLRAVKDPPRLPTPPP